MVIWTLTAVLFIGISIFFGYYKAIAVTPDNATYVSNSKCKACHAKIFKAQSETPHAKNFAILIDMGEDKNPKCFPCHTTGYGKVGGFTDAKSTPDLTGITCQACHGPGSAHIAGGLSKEKRKELIGMPTAHTCAKCHNMHSSAHEDLGKKALPYLRNEMKKLEDKIKRLEG